MIDLKPIKNMAKQSENETLKNILLTQKDQISKEDFLGLFSVLWGLTENKVEANEK